MRIAAVQPACAPRDLTGNAQIHVETVHAAQARVVVFPELSLTGYELDAEPVSCDDPALRPIVDAGTSHAESHRRRRGCGHRRLAGAWHTSAGTTRSRCQAGTSCHCWLAPPLVVHCTTCAPSLVEAPYTSATSPLPWLTMV